MVLNHNIPCSVLILTKNEEKNIGLCLEAFSWSDDIHVLDSGSSDRTVEIARSYGVTIHTRTFDNERDHRTYSIKEIEFKYDWVFNPDADELPEPELVSEVADVVRATSSDVVAYRVRFKNMFMGRWIKHCSLYPCWVVRLFKPQFISFEREINLRYVVDGREGRLSGHFKHFSFNNGLDAWFDKHNIYSKYEAIETIHSLKAGDFNIREIFCTDAVVRRRSLKELSFRLPGRAGLRFVYTYFFRGGFLDGYPGFIFSCLLAIYEFMIVLKVNELREHKGFKIPR